MTNTTTTKKLISIIVPVLNEEENITPFYQSIIKIFNELDSKYNFEIIFTDNHSVDSTFEQLQKINSIDSRVKVYRFSRDFGYQHSILTGYKKSSGEAVIQLDCDLEDPPSLMVEFINLWEQGYQVVYGIRKNREESILLQIARKAFYRLINYISDDELPVDAGDFRLVDRTIIKILRNNHDADPYIRGEISLMGFNQIGIEYNRNKRLHGESKFSISSYIKLATDGILNHSIKPLRLSSITGIIISFITIIGIIIYFIGKIIYGMNWPDGYATIVILLLAGLSMNALFLGIIGEYLGRIYKQIKFDRDVIIEKSIE